MTNRSLEKKVALVTGASRGIGRSIAVELAARGAFVYVNYNGSEDAANETVRLCEQAGGSGEAIRFNVADADRVAAAVDSIIKDKGSLDILVNNAGVNKDALLVRTANEDWSRIVETNLSGAFYATKAAARQMMKQRSGSIVNISSVVGESGNAGQVAYSASKAGLLGLTKSTALELGARGVRVNAICPGFIATDMTEAVLGNGRREEIEKQIPLGRVGTAEEIARAAAFLASEDASYITGAVLDVNGGLRT